MAVSCHDNYDSFFKILQDIPRYNKILSIFSRAKRASSGATDGRERLACVTMPLDMMPINFTKPGVITLYFVPTSIARASEHYVNASNRINRYYEHIQECLIWYICNELVPKARILRCNQDIAHVPERRICTIPSGHILELQFFVLLAHVIRVYLAQDLHAT